MPWHPTIPLCSVVSPIVKEARHVKVSICFCLCWTWTRPVSGLYMDLHELKIWMQTFFYFYFFIFFVIFPFTCWTCTGRTRTFLHFEAATVRPRQKRPCCDEQRWRVRWTTCLFWPRETLGEKKEIWKFRSYVFEIAFAWPLLIPSDTRPAPLILICFFREAWAVGFSVRN